MSWQNRNSFFSSFDSNEGCWWWIVKDENGKKNVLMMKFIRGKIEWMNEWMDLRLEGKSKEKFLTIKICKLLIPSVSQITMSWFVCLVS